MVCRWLIQDWFTGLTFVTVKVCCSGWVNSIITGTKYGFNYAHFKPTGISGRFMNTGTALLYSFVEHVSSAHFSFFCKDLVEFFIRGFCKSQTNLFWWIYILNFSTVMDRLWESWIDRKNSCKNQEVKLWLFFSKWNLILHDKHNLAILQYYLRCVMYFI